MKSQIRGRKAHLMIMDEPIASDPTLPLLRDALGSLQRAVAEGAMTPHSANVAMGKIADSAAASNYQTLPPRAPRLRESYFESLQHHYY